MNMLSITPCEASCQRDVLHYAVLYWVLLLPLWLSGLALMLVLFLVGLSYRRWPVAVGGAVIGVVAALTTYALLVAALATKDLVVQVRQALADQGGHVGHGGQG